MLSEDTSGKSLQVRAHVGWLYLRLVVAHARLASASAKVMQARREFMDAVMWIPSPSLEELGHMVAHMNGMEELEERRHQVCARLESKIDEVLASDEGQR